MQGIYAITQSKDDSLEKQNKFLKVSIDNTYTLYLLLLGLLIELRNHAKEQVELSSKKYLENAIAALEKGKSPDPATTKAIGCSIKSK